MMEEKASSLREVKRNALQKNVNELEKLRSLMSVTSTDISVDSPVSRLRTIEHLVKEFCPLNNLVSSVTSTTLYSKYRGSPYSSHLDVLWKVLRLRIWLALRD